MFVRSLCLLALLASAAPIGAEPGPVRIRLNRAQLVWTPRQGLAVTYDGTPVFTTCPQEITVHTRDWQRALYVGSTGDPRATLAHRGAQQVLTVRLPEDGFHGTQTIVAGPGDRYRIEWRYSQDAWDDAAVQVGLPRPTVSFLAGASFEGRAGDRPLRGVVPFSAPTAHTNPFSGATEVTFSSVTATVRLKSNKPLTLFDYAKRFDPFFLGYDEPMPRGREARFAVDVELEPPALERRGLIVRALRVPGKTEDGVVRASVRLARGPGGPAKVSVRLVGTGGDGQRFEARREIALSAKPVEVALLAPVPQPGTARCTLSLAVVPGGREVYRTGEVTVAVTPLMDVMPDLSLYTSEARGAFLVRVPAALAGRALLFTAEGAGVSVRAPVRPGERTPVPFEVTRLADGTAEVTCRLLEGGRPLATATVALRKAPPRPNEVKIDYAHRGLVVDGRPYLPFGFYCVFPPEGLPTEEAPHGFTHIAPYQDAGADPDRVREYLDRCAAVGMKVHYDIRSIAQAPSSPEKWEKLRAAVEAVRDHPALLCWYLCDEPDGQGIPPALLEESYRFVKQLDPYHPVTMVFCVPPRAPDYVKGMDIMMADPYPIPNGPVTMVSDVADGLNRAVEYGMPLWIVPQAFGGGEGWRREPSAAEERAMTYLAFIHGATGIQYFIRRAPIGNPIAPSLWSECRRLALEARDLAPALLSTERRPRVTCSTPAVHVAAWRHAGAITVLAANTENRPLSVRISVEERATGSAAVLFANRSVEVKRGVLEDMIDGFGTRAYRIPVGPAPRPLAEIHPRNLTVNPSYEDCANPCTPDGCYVGVGRDPGASVFAEPGVAVHGQHALRVTTPAEGVGVSIMPFPVPTRAGRRYRLSIWARGLQDGLRFRFGMRDLSCGEQEFTAGRQWKEYALEGTAATDNGRSMLGLQLISKGTIWFDLMQMVEVAGPR